MAAVTSHVSVQQGVRLLGVLLLLPPLLLPPLLLDVGAIDIDPLAPAAAIRVLLPPLPLLQSVPPSGVLQVQTVCAQDASANEQALGERC